MQQNGNDAGMIIGNQSSYGIPVHDIKPLKGSDYVRCLSPNGNKLVIPARLVKNGQVHPMKTKWLPDRHMDDSLKNLKAHWS